MLGPARRAAARERAALGDERAEAGGELVQARAVEARAGAARVDEIVAVVDSQVDGAEKRARALRIGVAADHEFLPPDALDLAPFHAAPGQVARVGPLCDDALQPRLAGGVEELRAVAFHVVGVAHRPGSGDDLVEERLPVGEREPAHVAAEEGEAVVEVRRHRHRGRGGRHPADQVHAALEPIEARAARRVECHDLAVEREVPPRERRERDGDLGVPLRHARAAACPELDPPLLAQREQAHAVPLELEEPAGSAGHLLDQGGQHEGEARRLEAHARQRCKPSRRPHPARHGSTVRV